MLCPKGHGEMKAGADFFVCTTCLIDGVPPSPVCRSEASLLGSPDSRLSKTGGNGLASGKGVRGHDSSPQSILAPEAVFENNTQEPLRLAHAFPPRLCYLWKRGRFWQRQPDPHLRKNGAVIGAEMGKTRLERLRGWLSFCDRQEPAKRFSLLLFKGFVQGLSQPFSRHALLGRFPSLLQCI